MNEIVNDYGVVWVASAGNHGEYFPTLILFIHAIHE